MHVGGVVHVWKMCNMCTGVHVKCVVYLCRGMYVLLHVCRVWCKSLRLGL